MSCKFLIRALILLLYFQAIITLILATDMARHGEILDSFKQKVDNFDFTNEEHVTCVCIHYVSKDHIASQPDVSCLLYCTYKI